VNSEIIWVIDEFREANDLTESSFPCVSSILAGFRGHDLDDLEIPKITVALPFNEIFFASHRIESFAVDAFDQVFFLPFNFDRKWADLFSGAFEAGKVYD
jgi:hypothetical protein